LDLQEILKQRDEKLAEAQKVQAELLKKERELDDARRELDLTIEKRVGDALNVTRQQARKEAADERERQAHGQATGASGRRRRCSPWRLACGGRPGRTSQQTRLRGSAT